MPSDTKINSNQKNQQYVHYFFFNNKHSVLNWDNFTTYRCRLPFISYNHSTFLYLHYLIGSYVNSDIHVKQNRQKNVVLCILNGVLLTDQ